MLRGIRGVLSFIAAATERGGRLFEKLKAEIDSIMERDPAARSRWEVYFLYSGFKAGIEIHPGATIGKGLFIDHGMGVVIGETAEIGDNCTLYQNVTLGGTGKDTGKRHPTLGNNVLVGSGAKVLGPFRVGDNARIAAGAVVLSEVPDNATAVGVPAKIVRVNGVKPTPCRELDQIHVTDPVALKIAQLECQVEQLRRAVAKLSDEKKE